MISVEHLSKSFEGLDVLKDVNCEIDKGEVICVIGPSGAGKSTFLRCLNMLEKPTSGRIIFEGADLTDKHTDLNLHRQKMGMVFQQFNLFPHMTVLDNLTCAPIMLKKEPKEKAEARAIKTLGTYKGWTAVKEGLKAGEKVVISGVAKIFPGAKVTEVTPTPNEDISGDFKPTVK